MAKEDQIRRQTAKLFKVLETKSLFEAAPEIMKLAETCRKARLWKANKDEFLAAYKELDAEKTWKVLLFKINHAPTTSHVYGVIILLIPVLADKLEHETKEDAIGRNVP